MNINKKTKAVFIDLAKAFDMVPHNILISQLEELGIRGMALDFL